MATINGTNYNDRLNGTNYNDLIKGLNGNDTIFGNAGNDTIDSGLGIDAMAGGKGNDTYYVDNVNDRIIEYYGQGSDTVYSQISYTLAANVENLILTGSANLSARANNMGCRILGNSGNNTIYGGTASDIIDGGLGLDSMIGGKGNDTYYIDNINDVIVEKSGEGSDTVYSSVSYTLAANVESLVLTGDADLTANANNLGNRITGNSGKNLINGGTGNDTIDGGTGIDTMRGGSGDDTYYVDNINDVIIENSNEGSDTVYSEFINNLPENIENLTLTGNKNLSIYGNSQNNILTGNDGDNAINGLEGNDILNGGLGNDTMTGGLGDDGYYIDNPLDKVVEYLGQGNDTVYSSISYTLGENFENLFLIGNENLVAYGNNSGNRILGNNGNCMLYGGSGNDMFFSADNMSFIEHYEGTNGSNTMYGRKGNDSYIVNDVNDKVVENLNEGKDTVYIDLNTYTLPDNIENGYLIIAGNKDLYGNSLSNILHGNCYANFIYGDAGNDEIYSGGYGNDTLVGGEGNDKLLSSLRHCLLYGGAGNDSLIGSEGNDSLYGGAGSDIFRGFTKNSTAYHYNIGFGNDIIDDTIDLVDGKEIATRDSVRDVDILDLTSFSRKEAMFDGLDLDKDGKLDGLLVDFGQYGTIEIRQYFDDTSSLASSSHVGLGGNINLHFNNTVLHFDDIQAILH